MKFDVGDTVLLLHSKEEGTVVEILDEETVSVRVKGVVFPVYTDQLDYPYFKRFSERASVVRKPSRVRGEDLPVEKGSAPAREETGVMLSFLPEYDEQDDALVQTLKIHLLNETALSYTFSYRLLLNSSLELEVKNTLRAFSHFYLQDLPFEALNDRPRFEFSFSPAVADPRKVKSHEVLFRPRAKQIIGKLNTLHQRREATFSHLLFEKYPDATALKTDDWGLPETSPRVKYVSPAAYPAGQAAVYEVDLHIEKLVDHAEGLSPSDMLLMQLAELQKQLDLAIARRQSSLVVIHGVGKGVLRGEVHEILHHTPQVKSFVNQYDARYGYGATEIFFEYK
jgi:hypothetical protein